MEAHISTAFSDMTEGTFPTSHRSSTLVSLINMPSLPTEKGSGLPSYGPITTFAPPSDEVKPRPKRSAGRWAWAGLVATAVLYLLYNRNHHCSHSQVEPRTSTFINHCNSLLVSPTGTYTTRISHLITSLESNSIYISEPGTSSEYYIGGFSSRDWWLSERPLLIAITPSKNLTILTAKFEQSRAEQVELPKEIRDITTFVPWLESESPYEILKNYLGAEVGRVVVDGQVRSFITEGLDGAGFARATKEEGEIIKEIRERKDEREIELLRCANQVCRPLWIKLKMQMTLHAIRETREKMYFGITESQTRTILEKEMAMTGPVGGDGLVLFGGTSHT